MIILFQRRLIVNQIQFNYSLKNIEFEFDLN